MEDVYPPGVAQPADDDTITAAPPLSPEQQENEDNEDNQDQEEPSAIINPIQRPGLLRQTLDIPTAQKVSRQTTPAPLEAAPPPPIQHWPAAAQGNDNSGGAVLVPGADNSTEGKRKSNWRSLKFLVSFWQKKPREAPPQNKPPENRRGWRRLRDLFAREPPPTESQTPGNEAQQTHSPSVADGDANTGAIGEVNNTGVRGRTGGRRRSSRTVRHSNRRGVKYIRRQAVKPSSHRPPEEPAPLKEIDAILEEHRSKVSAGHQGHLRGLLASLIDTAKHLKNEAHI